MMTLHVFSGTFGSREAACKYTQEQWEEPAPDDSWSDDDCEAWENRNPTWAMHQDLKVNYLTADFIETIFSEEKMEYLQSQLAKLTDFEELKSKIDPTNDTFVLIMSEALGGFGGTFASTPKLNYHGEYPWKL